MGFIRVTFVDILDIVLVAMLMFYLYKVLKGSHAMSILSGILLLFVIYIVVNALNMELLSAIMSGLMSVGLIALVVIFQPEIRRFLQVIGNQSRSHQKTFLGRIFGFGGNKSIDQTYIAPLVSACADMSASKTGALVLIKCEGSLQEIIDSGVTVDAVISPSLIKNIFFKNSPLHDGAMVIVGNRITAAKCVLPSTRSEVPLSFGMRHRAALGAAEVTDAIVVVVSEETGNISVAHNGRIKVGLSSTELQAELMRLSASEEPQHSHHEHAAQRG
ncbi:MAG TPA: diadenylate cyclase CdaA [Candidatus Tidjanibacter faecipullorum]|uniref:Diadenylate cyclase n=1 Tax=Candidatus Tidjanibacter faecipullorum TaxID=2838766 RepID=A0A9D2ILL2_9BACT|nr:diadenylate cyclase CdaA [Candidatus Tidjanibacter faecipullorum]